MLKAARMDQKAKRQLNLELWNVPHTVQTPMGQTLQNGGVLIFLKNIFQKKGKVESLHNTCLGTGRSDHVQDKEGR